MSNIPLETYLASLGKSGVSLMMLDGFLAKYCMFFSL